MGYKNLRTHYTFIEELNIEFFYASLEKEGAYSFAPVSQSLYQVFSTQ